MHSSNRRSPSRVRKATGLFLSALLLLGYYSPQAAFLRQLPETLHMALGQEAVMESGFPFSLSVSQGDVQVLTSTDERLGGVRLRAGQEGVSKVSVSLFGLLPLRDVEIDVDDNTLLIPGGQAVGVAMRTEGVLVVGTSDLSGTGGVSPARMAGVKPGDIITEIGGEEIDDTARLTELVTAAQGQALPLKIKRGQDTLELLLQPQKDAQTGTYRIGAWVRDSTAGVGTLSFYRKLDNGTTAFGALGHAITDSDTEQILPVSRGQIMLADIVDVKMGQRGVPGELKGSFLREARVLGDIQKNNLYGIYGVMTQAPEQPLYPGGLPIGRKDAVHTGKASILSTIGTEGMKEYEVEITKVSRQNVPSQKSMVLRVTDERLLQKTGGIVQGMSGSPILQDGRIIGAVTHVYVNDPTQGYGLYIEWMLAQQEP